MLLINLTDSRCPLTHCCDTDRESGCLLSCTYTAVFAYSYWFAATTVVGPWKHACRYMLYFGNILVFSIMFNSSSCFIACASSVSVSAYGNQSLTSYLRILLFLSIYVCSSLDAMVKSIRRSCATNVETVERKIECHAPCLTTTSRTTLNKQVSVRVNEIFLLYIRIM